MRSLMASASEPESNWCWRWCWHIHARSGVLPSIMMHFDTLPQISSFHSSSPYTALYILEYRISLHLLVLTLLLIV